MRAAQHGKSTILHAAPADYVNLDYELVDYPIRVGGYRTEEFPLTFDVMTGDTCKVARDDDMLEWQRRMADEYGWERD